MFGEIIDRLRDYKHVLIWIRNALITKRSLGSYGVGTVVETPVFIEYPKSVFMDHHTRLRRNSQIINAPYEKVIIKKFSVISSGVTIITNSHRSTVGIPHILLGPLHINDKSADVIINEDVWVGANAMIMPGVTIGRGAIVGAGSLVTKDVPPYALVVGRPAKIVAKNFFLVDVFRHEEESYPIEERLPKDYLQELFDTTYKDLKVYGCNTPLTEDERKQLLALKKEQKFI